MKKFWITALCIAVTVISLAGCGTASGSSAKSLTAMVSSIGAMLRSRSKSLRSTCLIFSLLKITSDKSTFL